MEKRGDVYVEWVGGIFEDSGYKSKISGGNDISSR